ncbi:hypothetical protein TYRP_006820 [Tyrophagus putrescentiae]|nr:hypothetical protein TYRP_006820 [Tyrophagus putrescentiae]
MTTAASSAMPGSGDHHHHQHHHHLLHAAGIGAPGVGVGGLLALGPHQMAAVRGHPHHPHHPHHQFGGLLGPMPGAMGSHHLSAFTSHHLSSLVNSGNNKQNSDHSRPHSRSSSEGGEDEMQQLIMIISR